MPSIPAITPKAEASDDEKHETRTVTERGEVGGISSEKGRSMS